MLARIGKMFAREEAPVSAPAETVPVQVKQLENLCVDLGHAVKKMDAHAVTTILEEIETFYKLEEESLSIHKIKHWAGEIASIKAEYQTALLTEKINQAIISKNINRPEGRCLQNSTRKQWIIPQDCDTPNKIREYIATMGECSRENISLVFSGSKVRTDDDLLSRNEKCDVVIKVPEEIPAQFLV
ncbi:MAG: hypothetical protein Q8K75_05480 [Chlamydiales bacterium]|nr:hypothetical protein [Chlamydiales bacterium]